MKNDVKWNNLKIIVPYIIGQLSEKKVKLIVNNLREDFFKEAELIMANSNAAAIELEKNKKSLIIEPQQITYTSYLEGEFDKDSMQTQFETILNALLIDDHNQYLFNIEGELDTDDSHTNSKELFSKKYLPLNEEIYGVGYRFLIKSDKLFGEFKIEPLVARKSGYYFQWILNQSESVTIADMLSDVQKEMEKDWNCCYSVMGR